MWRWLVQGLDGLLGMMAAAFENTDDRITPEQLARLNKLAVKLDDLKAKLQARDA